MTMISDEALATLPKTELKAR